MKKLVYLAALLGVAAGSFAFLPKEAASPQYGMLVMRREQTGLGSFKSVDLTTVIGTTPKLESIPLKGGVDERLGALHQLEATRLNELAAENWTVVSSHSQSSAGSFSNSVGLNTMIIETSFVLVKR